MKLINKILYGILGLIVLLCALILLCSLSPGLREKLSGLAQVVASSSVNQHDETQTEEYTYPAESVEEQESSTLPADEGNAGLPQIPTPSENGNGNTAARPSNLPEGLEHANSDYVSPGRGGISVPGAVSGKNGLNEIKADNAQVSDQEAEDLQSTLEYGDAGDGYTFDETMYPYYAMLDSQGQHLYRQLYANTKNVYKTFAPIEQVSQAGLKNIFMALCNDHPELFWLNTQYSAKYAKDGKNLSITLSFNDTADNLGQNISLFENAANSIISGANSLRNNYEKEKYVHNTLIAQVLYNASAKNNQSAYSALVGGQSVCAGYARALQYVLMQMGIPCYYCTGYAGESHAWNIVSLEDGYYNVDPTWDDVDGGKYDYFNKTDNDYATTHVRTDLSVYLPACTGNKYRNLEQNDPVSGNNVSGNNTAGMRSLEDFGLTQNDVLKTLDAYFSDCYNKIVFLGKGDHTFSNVVDASIINSVTQAYSQETYQLGYMENALQALGGGTCQLRFYTEPMKDNLYLVTHVLSIQ
ncbi:MAG: hypothetical protein K6A92_08915 [Lachnospiraceae bacterium]|nr:hypothetical protein [Lachnospiraceae bacterium]